MTANDKYSRLLSRCSISSGIGDDRFVGLKFDSGKVTVSFPQGYSFPSTYDSLQGHISALLAVLQEASASSLSPLGLGGEGRVQSESSSLLSSYQFLVLDFITTGRLYSETESTFSSTSGTQISWPKTIARRLPMADSNGSLVYLDFIKRSRSVFSETRITLLHERCLSLGFSAIGWLYSAYVPPPARISTFNTSDVYLITDKLRATNNDREKSLLQAILSIVSAVARGESLEYTCFGTERFEYVWEYMLDRAFCNLDKSQFFPRSEWIVEGRSQKMTALEPDSVMEFDGSVYILDAKYYRFGTTGFLSDLPATSSIAKQVVYGQYAARVLSHKRSESEVRVYNAFLLPFDCGVATDEDSPFAALGYASVDWISDPRTHEVIVGVGVDTVFLLENYYSGSSTHNRLRLASCIQGIISGALN